MTLNDNFDSIVKEIRLHRKKLELIKPYALSFATLNYFEALLCELQLENGNVFYGEVIPLVGYMDTTLDEIEDEFSLWQPEIVGKTLQNIADMLDLYITQKPMFVSALYSMIDSARIQCLGKKAIKCSVPLVYAISATDRAAIDALLENNSFAYDTIKIKIGESFEADLDCVKHLQALPNKSVKLRFDANQAYEFDAIVRFCDALENHIYKQVELVEQPFAVERWDLCMALSRRTRVPIMADESIVDEEDILRAHQSGCRYIKLKYCKQGSLARLNYFAQQAKSLGMNVVVGNGVATDIVNYLELANYHQNPGLFSGACEANGFAKLHNALIYSELTLQQGCAFFNI